MTCPDLFWAGTKDPRGCTAMAAHDEPDSSAAGQLCRCGHTREAHSHYRKGSDCALCACPRFRIGWRAVLFGRFAR